MYLKATRIAFRIEEFTLSSTYYKVITLQINCKMSCIAFRPPDADVTLLYFLDKLFSYINMNRCKSFIPDDFKVDLSGRPCDQIAFSSLHESRGFCNTATSSNRIFLESYTIIDAFMTSVETEHVIARTVVSYASGHFPIVCFVGILHNQIEHSRSPPLCQSVTRSALHTLRKGTYRFNLSNMKK